MKAHGARRFFGNSSGVSAVEFAVLAPLLISLMFGGFSLAKTVAISRKITITTRALADLTTQYPSLSTSTLATIFGASTQIIAPYDTTPLGMRITEVKLDITGLIPTVTCSATSGTGFTAYTAGSLFTPFSASMPHIPNASFIYAETTYSYVPFVGSAITGPIKFGDRIYMLPRLSSSITFPGPC